MAFTKLVLVACIVTFTYAFEDINIMNGLRENNLMDFVQLLKDANQNQQLTGPGPFTILAPTNEAISNMDPELLAVLGNEPVLLKQIVQYHIIPDFTVLPELASLGEVASLEGQPLKFSGSGGNIMVNNVSRALAGEKSDIVCNNGIIHIIDKVLIPPIFSTDNIPTRLLVRDDIFRDLAMALLLNNLTNILQGSEFTLFAPTDLGFARYSEIRDIRPDMPNAQKIYFEVLKYHIVPGRRTSHQLRDGQKLYTMHGVPVDININASGMRVDHAAIVEADIAASNGVIHAIDHIIFPTDLLDQLSAALG